MPLVKDWGHVNVDIAMVLRVIAEYGSASEGQRTRLREYLRGSSSVSASEETSRIGWLLLMF
jgi:hypothetical protein